MLPSLTQLASRTGRLIALAGAAAALAGCQGVVGSLPYAQVRYIDASPDAPAIDVYQNGALSLYNLGFASKSSYVSVPPGAYIYAANLTSTQQQLAAARGNFTAANQYTVLVGNVSANLQMTVLKDQSVPAPTGRVGLHFLHQATRAGAVDIYLVPASGTLATTMPILAGVSFSNAPIYLDVPSGTYSIVVLPTAASTITAPGAALTAATPTLYSGNQVAYPGTSVRTILLLDQPSTSTGVQIVTADDYDSPFPS